MKKRSRLKKGLAILLTTAMVVGLVPNAGVMKASAAETYDENGFAADGSYQPATDNDTDGVYEISNAGQFYWFADYVNNNNASASGKLINNIDLKGDGSNQWTPIGSFQKNTPVHLTETERQSANCTLIMLKDII